MIVLGEHHDGLIGNLFGADVDAEVRREAGCDVILAQPPRPRTVLTPQPA